MADLSRTIGNPENVDTATPDLGLPVESRKDIALAWIGIDGRSSVLREIGRTEHILLPFAACGAEVVEKLRREESFVPTHRLLTLGVLMDDDHGTTADRNLFPSDAQSHGLVEWSARKEGIPPERHALDACLYSHSSHGSEIAAMTYRRADGLFPGDGPILTRRIGNLWTYAELNRGFRREEYPKILERLAELFTGRYVTGKIPPVPGRGYAVYAGLSALRLLGRESEAVALRFGRIPEARLDDKELALADHALAEDPRKPFGKDGPTLVEMSGTTRIPSGQNLAHVFLVGPFLWPREEANDTHGDGTVIRRVLN